MSKQKVMEDLGTLSTTFISVREIVGEMFDMFYMNNGGDEYDRICACLSAGSIVSG